MKLRELLTERLLGVDQRGTKYYINPRYPEVMALLSRIDHFNDEFTKHELRGYMIGGNLYVWNAYDDIHKYGRKSLHDEFGVGPDAYSGRPLVIRLKDGVLNVMLGGIRNGYFVTIGEATVNKFARLRAAVTPPQPIPEAILRESPEMQAGFELIARLLIQEWAQRIQKYASTRYLPILDASDLAAGSVEETFKNRRHLKKLPERLRDFIKYIIKRNMRLVAKDQYDAVNGRYLPSSTAQLEITLFFDSKYFKANLEQIRAGNITIIGDVLNTRYDTLIHELHHAYDDYASKGKYRTNQSTKQAKQDEKVATANPTAANRETAYQSYLQQPLEINARFGTTVALIQSYLHGPWNDYLFQFKDKVGGWYKMDAKIKRRLIQRLAMQWTDVHSARAPIDITPFIQKLDAKLRATAGKVIQVQNAHGNIELSGLSTAPPRAQAMALTQATYLGDIFQRQVVTYDDVPMLKGFGFVKNKGRNIDYRISARFRRSPMSRPARKIAEGVALRNGDLIVYSNPTRQQFKNLQARVKNKSIRAILYFDTVYIWDAFLAEHTMIAHSLGIPGNACYFFEIEADEAIFNWAENNKESVLMDEALQKIRSSRAIQRILGTDFTLRIEYW